MAKLYKTYNRFDGGLNTKSDPRDLADNELSSATSIAVDILGKVRNLGAMVAHSQVGTKNTNVRHGCNLFYFHSDYDRGDASFANASDTGEDWLAFADHQQANGIHLYNPTDDAWYTSATTGLTLGSGSGSEIVFYYADGALRCINANFRTNNTNKWWGYIKRTHFSGITPGGTADTYDAWYVMSNRLKAPIMGLGGEGLIGTCTSSSTNTYLISNTYADLNTDQSDELDSHSDMYFAVQTTDALFTTISGASHIHIDADLGGGGTWQSKGYAIYPPAGDGFNVDITRTAAGGSWAAGIYELGLTFLYDNSKQESAIYKINNTDGLDIAANDKLTVKILATSPYSARLTGGRVYIRLKDSNDSWVLLADISLKSGVRTKLDTSYSAWSLETSVYAYASAESLDANIDTYETLNGFSQDEQAISVGQTGMGFSDAIVFNSRAWAFHPKSVNEDGETVEMGDRILYTPVGKYDTWPTSYFLDIATNDGDSFVTGKGFADRILAFKSRKLYIINVAQGSDTGWYIESEHVRMGVEHRASVCATDYGIAWCNKFGVYFYDGNRIHELTQKLDIATWTSFFKSNQSNDPTIIGFEPVKKQIIVMQDSSTSDGNAYVYDMRTKSWVYADSVFVDGKGRTNFVVDWNQNLIHAYTGGIFNEWDSDPQASGAWELTLKDDDFGYPGLHKNIYNIIVTYKSDTVQTSVIKYAVNGGTTFTIIPGSFAVTTDWDILKLSPSISGTIQSLQIRIDPLVAGKIEINDVTVVYRVVPKVVS